ncbi:peptidoglycan DD-metalloendopeptidase family protein [Shinella yambaruensis]|uniref:Lipoprotein n=1 Tax=Shinella yambaruensis TaxID=415996 RepID=A0ABQ5ZD22_9HYPH|nr:MULTISPECIES: peptidoglycan DD-metalloendopeptidase family protein [Shinella]CAI0337577.1 Murein DD-endopeptidase MepM/ murein hydrolase activator NlpD [Rhizobiaceae bacterium]CAK7256059.1 lipoprotein NlpD [Shinella sp. WSC3-e]MCJ8024095.1 peptidoglycan DD-metalloendopeptidase family protein [Shinella yambaruensis]MCO5140445.1 peptidoglycan DD-metalloendopeptidase family protein [Shinella sp.]MCU7978756.1 peptidoglycan DD-metalloendopeptidase family protein [Shinella yambaruensis]
MRKSVSPSFARTTTRLVAAALLASVATGCSSDVSRFGGLFSSSGQDNITTSSVPRRTLLGGNPVPRGNVGNGQQFATADQLGSREEALNQPFPDQGTVSYDPINTATTGGSGTRLATTPMSVQRGELADPTLGARQSAEREVALGQQLPERKAKAIVEGADNLTTSTVNKGKAGWSTRNAPVVMLRQGESVKTLANRYGVPEKEILAANNLKRASDAEPGQKIVIPTFSTTASAAKASTDSTLKVDNKLPTPERKGEQNVAILPTTSSREKLKSESGQTNSNVADAGEGKAKGGYEVQPGDSLAKIARSNGVSVDALKKANGLETASIRIGQKLVIPAGGSVAAAETTTDRTVTASVPVKKEKAVETAEKKPEAYKAPVKTVSVTEVAEKSDVTEEAPESTGIGKYRWPVRGAVIAGYGANVEGNRNDGIDISVPEGTPIKAAENGVVIYAGSSLKELGNAVLVRHDDGTVTVYGHAGDLNVQRGQKIQRGQTVATSGMSGNATRPKVHFEVRKNATPVNPMTFLE